MVVEASGGKQGRRRVRSSSARSRQVVVRFSDEEWELVRSRAALAGLAVGAWIGQVAVDQAVATTSGRAGLLDLLRLHADVVETGSLDGVDPARVAGLLERLDAVVDAVVVEVERGRR